MSYVDAFHDKDRDVIQVVTSIEIPLPESSDLDNNDGEGNFFKGDPPMTA